MKIKFKINNVEISPSSQKEGEILFNSITTNDKFIINNLIEKTLTINYEDAISFNIENLLKSLGINDLSKITSLNITSLTNPLHLGITEKQESVPFGLYKNNEFLFKTAQFILTNTSELIHDYSLIGLFPNIENKSILIKILIGLK